ncbi:MAG: hypothetical protein AAFP13_15400 [Pseudomonadota bacterium]
MEQIAEFSDTRHRYWCIHCGQSITNGPTSQDHVPSKSLLDKPYPAELPTVEICRKCNSSFSLNEDYFSAFLGAALSRTTDPEKQVTTISTRILSRNLKLRERIEKSRTDYQTLGGKTQTIWKPEHARIHNVIVKNARGHVYFELGQPALGEPASVSVIPMSALSDTEQNAFFDINHDSGWPEIGSRLMTRRMTRQDLDGSWVVVQDGVYRFAATEDDGFLVRTLIRDYLAAEVIWRH